MKKTIGLVSANYTNTSFGELTETRSLATLPFAGRYRLIDFPLSNFVNSGIDTVGVIAPYNFRSLIDHLGVGKEWSLNRKIGGMFVLPGAVYGMRSVNNKFLMRDLMGSGRFLDRDNADYVLFCGSNTVINMDFHDMIVQHEESGCAVTLCYKKREAGEKSEGVFLNVSENGEVTDIIHAKEGGEREFLDIMILDRSLLMSLLEQYKTLEHMNLLDIIKDDINNISIGAYEYPGYAVTIDTPKEYFRANMDVLKMPGGYSVFGTDRIIYTKVQDEPPVIYREGSSVKNSLVATGCLIEGTVENSVIFRHCRIEKDVVIKNSIVMQHGTFRRGAHIENAILDKYVTINEGVQIIGNPEKYVIIGKNKEV